MINFKTPPKPANANRTVADVVLEKCRIDTYRRNGENRMPDYWPIVRLARFWAEVGRITQRMFW